MCGIVGYIGPKQPLPVVISGLEKLEYRGYDSAGVAVLRNGGVEVTRALGKLSELKKALNGKYDPNATGTSLNIAIGHTRWATHGRPSEDNAHPHTAGTVSLIHNGIIENYLDLRAELEAEGCAFKSETDTEIVAHLLNQEIRKGSEPFVALKKVCERIRGSYAFVAIDASHPDRILIAKNATPIVVGIGDGEMIVASDIPAVLSHTRSVVILEDGDIAELSLDGLNVENEGSVVEREPQTITWDPVTAQKGGYKHFMLKEIHEQGLVISETFRGRLDLQKMRVDIPEIKYSAAEVRNFKRIILLGCGTAWHACLLAKFYIEEFSGIPCEVDYSSEFRYRQGVYDKDTLIVAVSQSGETADTLAAMERVSGKNSKIVVPTLAICNVLGSSLARKISNTLFTRAGPEISVASTKAFTTQLIAAFLLGLWLGEKRGVLDKSVIKQAFDGLLALPGAIEDALKQESAIEQVARDFHRASDFLFLGRGNCYPIALEGALKLKEISYIHAEGYPAGEMKHGPIALIDEDMPVVMVLQRSSVLHEKMISNLREVESRAGQIILITDVQRSGVENIARAVIEVPFVSEWLSPVLLTLPLQLLAYYVAVMNGTDVDLPRNLAKSVTVE